MESRVPQSQDIERHSRQAHEPTDVRAGWIFVFVVFLLLSLVGIEWIMRGTLKSLEKKPAPGDQWQPRRQAAYAPTARFPRLQISAPLDLERFRAREDAEINSYGWINRSSNLVHIPIERAMDLLLEKGLPVRQGTNQLKSGPSPYELIQQRKIETPAQP